LNFSGDVVIGLEIHIGINTKFKLFSCAPNIDGSPNTHVTAIDLGHPGTKPVVNIEAIRKALQLCVACNSEIAKEVVFSRKSYFYPDLAKNYQISQYELPIGSRGTIELSSGKKIGLMRIHIEEDPASLVHVGGVAAASYSFIDYNRSGTPLVELVTLPDMSSPDEAREFLRTLIGILTTLGIFDQKDGLMKADANISIKESGYVRAEIKNINGFKEIERALISEIARQKEAVSKGEKLFVETRGWDSESGTTYLMRRKETEADYGYIIDTDLVPITISEKMIPSIPELPVDFARRISKEKNVSFEDVYIIANHKAFGSVYRQALQIDAKKATNWFRHVAPTSFVAKYGDLSFVESIPEAELLELFQLYINKKISDKVMKEILEKLVEEKFSPWEYVKANGLEMVSNVSELEQFCKEAISASPQAVEDYKKGEERALNYIVGQVMKKTKGTANPGEVSAIVKKLI
jgi:aspartyl-tRNA(Asn)/glutamyl-tRNA(Gln) amidotransferase subunit B